MEAFDKVEELLLAEGYSKEEIPAIMVSLVEQGFDPTQVFLGGLANMLDLLPKKRKPEPLPKTKVVPDLLPDTQQPRAPKPEFGPNATKPQTRVKPELRPGGRTPEPQFKTTQTARNPNPARNNLYMKRTNLRAPSIPAPVAATAKKGLWSRIAPRIAPVAKQAYAAYRGTERLSKGDYLGAALGYGTGIPGLPGNIAMVGDLLRGDPEVKNPDMFKPIPKRPGESDAGTSTATSGLPGFPKNTAQPDAYQSRPSSAKSDFEDRQAQVIRAQQRSTSATQRQVDKDNQRYGNTVPSGSFGISQQGRVQASAQRIEKLVKTERPDLLNKDSTPTPTPAPTPTPTPTPAPKPPAPTPAPKLTADQQAVNREYDRLRKSDPAAAVRYGLKMAKAGASKKSFKLPT